MPNTPKFVSGNLEGGNGYIKVTWTGLNSLDGPINGLKQVNIWIKGGTYGNDFVFSGDFFTKPGTKNLSLPLGEYYIKLQAQAPFGSLSMFSATQSSRSVKPLSPVTDISGSWSK